MKVVDLNILLYSVNKDSPIHVPIHDWWEEAINKDEPLGLPWLVITGFLRIATNPKIFPKPLKVETAIDKVDSWLALDSIKVVQESKEHWRILRSLLAQSSTAGNLTTDAHLAAIAISHGAMLVSCDNDFARFKGLRWENPINAP